MANRRRNLFLIRECENKNKEGVRVLMEDENIDLHYLDIKTKKIALHAICECTSAEIFKLIYPKVTSLELKDQNGRTLIYSAIKGEQSELVELLLKYGSSLNTVDSNGQNPLEYAATFSSPEFCTKLIKLKILNNKKCNILLLELSIKAKDLVAITAWLKKMKIENVIDRNRWTPLIYSSRFGDAKTMSFLLDTKVDIQAVDIHQKNALLALAYRSRQDADIYESIDDAELVEMMNMVIDRGISVDSVDKYGMSALHYAVLYHQTSAIQFLLGSKCNLNLQTTTDYNDIPIGATPLHIAIKANNIAHVELLCKAGADCNIDMTYDEVKTIHPIPIGSLNLAIKNHNFEIANLLLEFGSDINSQYIDRSVIHNAILTSKLKYKGNFLEFSKNILGRYEYNINMQNVHGHTILHEIFTLLGSYTSNDYLEIAKLICNSKNVNLNLHNDNGETALVTAVKRWISFHRLNPQMAELLTEVVKADIVDFKLSDKDGNTVLHHAFKQYSEAYSSIVAKTALREFMFLLIHQGCNKWAKNIIGQTPLHFYASNVMYRRVNQDDAFGRSRLIKSCVLKNDTDIYGNTILHHAISKHPKDFIANILHDEDTNPNSFDFINAKVPEMTQQEMRVDSLPKQYTGMTALQIALMDYRDCDEMIKYLLKSGADVHVLFVKDQLRHTVIEQIYNYFCKAYMYSNSRYTVFAKLFYPIFLLLSAGAFYIECTTTNTITEERRRLNMIEENLIQEKLCVPMLRRAARLGYKFNSEHIITVLTQDKKTVDVLKIVHSNKTVFPLEVLAAQILRGNLFPNAWVGAQRLNLPRLIYAEHFETYQNTPMPT